MSTPTRLAHHDQRVAGMLDDPACVGDLLLVGIVFARALDLGVPPLQSVIRDAAGVLYGAAEHSRYLHSTGQRNERGELFPGAAPRGVQRVKSVLASDIRRYVADLSGAYRCQRPIRGREPGHDLCSRSTSTAREYVFVDPVTGDRKVIGVCSQPRCRAWWERRRDRNLREVAEHPPPEPVANRGGVLERHLDEIDWPRIYSALDPSWRPPHEAPGWRPPKLEIVVGGLDDEDDLPLPAPNARPDLRILKGGW